MTKEWYQLKTYVENKLKEMYVDTRMLNGYYEICYYEILKEMNIIESQSAIKSLKEAGY